MVHCINDELGVFLIVDKIKKKPKKINLLDLKAIFTFEKKNDRVILLNKVYLIN
jgi:hypothetical protein